MNYTHLNFPIDIKEIGNREFEGHGAVFRNVDRGGDIIVPGAFRRTLSRYKSDGELPPMFWMHNPDQVPGVWKEMKEDERGLYVRGELVDTQLGNETRTLLRTKAVRGMSIGYRPAEIDFDEDGNRLLKEIDLWEVSVVSLAMNPLARVVAAKARLSHCGEYVPTEREIERLLRDAGCSKAVAKRVVSLIALDVDDDADSGGTLDPRRDAGDVDDGAKEVLRALEQSTGTLVGGVFDHL